MVIILTLLKKIQSMFKFGKNSQNKGFTALIIVILSSYQILLLKRGKTAPYMPGRWSLPGGASENGETPEEVAKRELKEETGLSFISLKKTISSDYDGYKVIFFITEIIEKPPISLDSENEEYGWFTLNQVAQLDKNREVIPGLYEDIKNNFDLIFSV